MSYDKLPEGVYTGCSIPFASSSQIVFGESSNKGTPYARVKLGVLEGDQTGLSIVHDLYLTEKTIEKTVKALRALGFTGERFADFMTQSPSQTVQFEVVHEEYNGQSRPKVKWIGTAPKPLAPEALDAISDKFSTLLIGTSMPNDSGNPDDELAF